MRRTTLSSRLHQSLPTRRKVGTVCALDGQREVRHRRLRVTQRGLKHSPNAKAPAEPLVNSIVRSPNSISEERTCSSADRDKTFSEIAQRLFQSSAEASRPWPGQQLPGRSLPC